MAIAGKLTTLWVGATPSKVSSIESVNCGSSAAKITTSALGDTWDSFIAGLNSGDEITASGFYDPADTAGQIALRTAKNSGTPIACEVRYGTTVPKAAFTGIVTGWARNSTTTTAVALTIKIQPSGSIVETDS